MTATDAATYREALARIARAAEQEAAAGMACWPMPPYDELESGIQRCYEAMGAAVAGKLLGDLLRLQTLCGCKHCQTGQAFIAAFADVRGIAITESES